MNKEQQTFLNNYLKTLPEAERKTIQNVQAEYFCADEHNANECARLINIGKKTASCSLKQGWDSDNEPLPKVGDLTVVLNWSQEPICMIKITDVSICPFNQVTAEFAKAEGEGDSSYAWWHKAHTQFFTEYAKTIGATFNTSSELVLERFVKVYPI